MTETPKLVRLTVYVTPEERTALRIRAARSGVPMTDIVAHLIRTLVGKEIQK